MLAFEKEITKYVKIVKKNTWTGITSKMTIWKKK